MIASIILAVGCVTSAPPVAVSSTAPSQAAASSATSQNAIVLVADVVVAPGLEGDIEATCRGSATVTLDPTPRGPLSLASAQFELTVASCPGGTRITAGRITRQGEPTNVLIDASLAPFDLPDGSGRAMGTNPSVRPALIDEIVAGPSGFVFSWTSRRHPAGGFRGVLRKR